MRGVTNPHLNSLHATRRAPDDVNCARDIFILDRSDPDTGAAFSLWLLAFVDNDGFVTKLVRPGLSPVVSSKLSHRLVRILTSCEGKVMLSTLRARAFVVAFWVTSHLISFIPIYERDIPLSDESINHKHTHDQ